MGNNRTKIQEFFGLVPKPIYIAKDELRELIVNSVNSISQNVLLISFMDKQANRDLVKRDKIRLVYDEKIEAKLKVYDIPEDLELDGNFVVLFTIESIEEI